MKKIIKYMMVFFMVSSLLVSITASSQVAPAVNFAVNRFLAAQFKAVQTGRGLLVSESEKIATAYTVKTMSTVATTEVLIAESYLGTAAISYSQAANVVGGAAAVGATVAAAASAPLWLTLLLTLGPLAFNVETLMNLSASTIQTNAPQLNLKIGVIDTPAGIRLVKKPLIISPLAVSTTNTAVLKAQSYGADIYRSDICITGDFCAQFPPRSSIVDSSYMFSAYIAPDYIETPVYGTNGSASNEQILVSFNYMPQPPVPDLTAHFKSVESFLAYQQNSGFCAPSTRNAVNNNLSGYLTYGPACIYSLTSKKFNVDHTFEQIKYNVEIAKLRSSPIDGSLEPYYQSTPQTFNNFLDAYAINAGKITFTQDELNQKLSPAVMASLLNKLWQKAAAQPDYKGVPYSLANPVTPSEISPHLLPNIVDLFSLVYPATATSVQLSPDGINPDPLVEELIKTCVKLEADITPELPLCTNKIDLNAPPLEAPILETPPTALSILQPLLDLITPNSTTNYSRVQGVCPTASFNVWSTDYTVDKHCDIAEYFRGWLAAIMLTIFAVSSYKIVMKA